MSKLPAILASDSERAHHLAQGTLCALAGLSVAAVAWAGWHGAFSVSGLQDAPAPVAAPAPVVEAKNDPVTTPPPIVASAPVIPSTAPMTQSAPVYLPSPPVSPIPTPAVAPNAVMPAGGVAPVLPAGREIKNQQARDMVDAARAVRRKGDMQAALESLRAADLLESNHPEIASELALTYEAMGIGEKSEAEWRKVLSQGEALAGGYFALAKAKLAGREDAARTQDKNPVRLGVCQVIPDKTVTTGQRIALRVPIIAAPGVEVEPTQMDIHVYFYDKTGPEGRIEPSKADAPDQNWVSAPVDWKDEGREELLDVIYNMPALKPEEVRDIGRRTFYGYVVKLFYRDRLVGEQAAPRDLLDFKPAVAAPAGADNALFPKN